MKRQMRKAMVGVGFLGAAVVVLAVILAIAEGYISDATHSVGNLVPAALVGISGACLMLVGFGPILFRRD